MEKVYCVYSKADGELPFLCAIAKNEKTANRIVEDLIQSYIARGKQNNWNPDSYDSDYGDRGVIFHHQNDMYEVIYFYFSEEEVLNDDDKED